MLPILGTSADEHAPQLQIANSWARATPPNITTSAIYMTIQNPTGQPLKIVEVKSTISDRIELHNTTHKDGLMQMRQLPAIDIPANSSVELKPHGMHMMIFNVKNALADGTKFTISVLLEGGKEINLEVPVKKQGENQSSMPQDHKMHHAHTKKPDMKSGDSEN